MKKINKITLSLLLILTLALPNVAGVNASTPEPISSGCNPTCQNLGLGYSFGYKIDPPNDGTYSVDSVGSITVAKPNAQTLNWTSTFGIDTVIVKGGSDSNIYIYNPPEESFGSNGLVSPLNSGGELPDISHAEFCYNIETEPYCELTLTKTDNVDPVEPGDEIIYHLVLENTGTADCTGTGVRIKDIFDPNTTYVSSSRTPEETTSTYIKWNVGTLQPGDKVEIDLTVLVSEETECGTILENKAKYWSNQTDWGNFVIEETTVECPPGPYCGDGIKNGDEECDGTDGVGDHQSCSQECVLIDLTYCGDTIKQTPNTEGTGGPSDDGYEECDGQDGVGQEQSCSQTCTLVDLTYCGDGVQQSPNDEGEYEECDGQDGVGLNQSCSQTCTLINLENCGDGIKNGDEECDGTDGVPDHYTCTQECTLEYIPYCGDETIDEGEQCDDGNNLDGDGCSSQCQIEESSTALYVIKNVVGGTATSGDFMIYVSGNYPSPASFPGEESPGTEVTLDPGAYSVMESTSSDYISLFSPDCASTITLGETKTCTITNTYQSECTPTTPCSVLGCGKTDSCGKYCGDCPSGCTVITPCSVLGCSKTDACGTYCGNCGESPFCGDGIVNGTEECDGEAGVTEGYICTDSCVLEEEICTMDLNIMMIMDVSGSMGNGVPTKLSQAQIAANSFIDNLRSSDQSGLVSFSWVSTLNKNLSNDHASTKFVIDGLVADGATNIGDAINEANKELMSVDNSSKIAKMEILLTDGKANQPNGNGIEEDPTDLALALNESLEAAENGITMLTIGLGDDVNTTMLQNMAQNTGGKYYFAPTSNDLSGIFDQISSETCKDSSATSTPYVGPPVAIFNARIVSVSNTDAVVSWLTNVPATSRVVYDSIPHSDIGNAPNYGYAWSTPEDSNKTTFHAVTITGLTPGTSYYWRPISQSSPEKLGEESTFSTKLTEESSAPLPPSEPGPEKEFSFEEESDEEGGIAFGPTEEDIVVLEEKASAGFLASIIDTLRKPFEGNIYLRLLIILIILFPLWLLFKKRKKKEGEKGKI